MAIRKRDERERIQAVLERQASRLGKLISFSGEGSTSGKQIMTAEFYFNHVSNMPCMQMKNLKGLC